MPSPKDDLGLDQDEEIEDQDSEDTEPDSDDTEDPLEGKEDLQKALLSLFLKCSAEDRYPRLIEVKDVKQAENYWAGRQNEWWSESEQKWKPITTPLGGLSQGSFNNYRTDGYRSSGRSAAEDTVFPK